MTTYMFPGQGSQYNGMGENLFKLFPKETAKASEILGYSISDLCLNDQSNLLQQTEYTQPAIFFVSSLYYLQRTHTTNETPAFVCGHSLGEYGALFAAEVFDLYTGLAIVRKRGELMAMVKNGGMMAVVGTNALEVGELLNQEGFSSIDIANFNSPDQVVLSGIREDFIKAKEFLEKHNFKCIELNVSGAFHSRYMESARIDFTRFLMQFEFNKPSIQIISSTTGMTLEENYVLENLGFQLTRPVKWVQTIRYLNYISTSFIEIGPGSVLTNLNRKILANKT